MKHLLRGRERGRGRDGRSGLSRAVQDTWGCPGGTWEGLSPGNQSKPEAGQPLLGPLQPQAGGRKRDSGAAHLTLQTTELPTGPGDVPTLQGEERRDGPPERGCLSWGGACCWGGRALKRQEENAAKEPGAQRRLQQFRRARQGDKMNAQSPARPRGPANHACPRGPGAGGRARAKGKPTEKQTTEANPQRLTEAGVSGTHLKVTVINIFRNTENKTQSFGSKLETIKVNHEAITELGNKHPRVKHRGGQRNGRRADGLKTLFAGEGFQIGPLNTTRCSTSSIIEGAETDVPRGWLPNPTRTAKF